MGSAFSGRSPKGLWVTERSSLVGGLLIAVINSGGSMEKKVSIFIVAVLILGAFYWVAVRPTLTRKHCNKLATTEAFVPASTGGYWPDVAAHTNQALYERTYSQCLRGNGL